MDSMPRVSIIILNWNGWKDTIECLESVYQITYQNYDVIVVDNGSENESIEKIKEYARGNLEVTSRFFDYSRENKPLHYIEYSLDETKAEKGKEAEIADLPSWKKLILINNMKNYGFAEGNNIAIRYALKVLNPEYVLLLNNDTIVDRNFLDELVNV
ncbi:glycosyltransferase, partial [Methanoculleus sp.]|uniref:glycosyltransferase family 2 protein n=1 Tax=Methanoculleus sp. TaxID=90427 RepID=UPI00320F503C